jgi:hypothetical protein
MCACQIHPERVFQPRSHVFRGLILHAKPRRNALAPARRFLWMYVYFQGASRRRTPQKGGKLCSGNRAGQENQASQCCTHALWGARGGRRPTSSSVSPRLTAPRRKRVEPDKLQVSEWSGIRFSEFLRSMSELPLSPRVLLPHTCTQDGWFLQPKRRPARLPRRTLPSNCICRCSRMRARLPLHILLLHTQVSR